MLFFDRLVTCLFFGIAALAVPAALTAQSVEADLGWSMIDHDPPASTAPGPERLPGMMNLVVRVGGTYFGQFDLGSGRGSDAGTVRYQVGLVGLGVGRRFRSHSGPLVWTVRPTVGFAYVNDTRRLSKWVATISIGGEVGYTDPLGWPLVLSLVAGVGRLEPLSGEACPDCFGPLLIRGLPRYSLGVGLRRTR